MNETAQSRQPMKPVLRRLRFRRFSTVQLLIALALLFTGAPFVEEIKGGELIVSGLFSLVLVAAVLAVADRKRVLVIALVLAVPAVGGRWINHFRPDLVPPAAVRWDEEHRRTEKDTLPGRGGQDASTEQKDKQNCDEQLDTRPLVE